MSFTKQFDFKGGGGVCLLNPNWPNSGEITELEKHRLKCHLNEIYWLKNIKSADPFLRCLGWKTITSVLSEFKSKRIVDIQDLKSLRHAWHLISGCVSSGALDKYIYVS